MQTNIESLEDASIRHYPSTEKVGYNYIQTNHKAQNKKREAFKTGAR